ncbi:phage tail protein [Brevibacillus ginsengisoli]|uniref:phage tail protein n=1 Tax=Brevibacillus ginsengisoli TaxID=363854 RepID=UPI003CE89BA6
MDAFTGEIRLFGGNFPPKNWAFCDGQLMSIATNPALFSILSTTYGGDGKTNFALPNLMGRAPLQQGQGPQGYNRTLGEAGGATEVTLQLSQLPAHTHQVSAQDSVGNTNNPKDAIWAQPPIQGKFIKTQEPLYATAGTSTMNLGALKTAGMGMPHNNRQPYLGLNFIICLNGYYPTRG